MAEATTARTYPYLITDGGFAGWTAHADGRIVSPGGRTVRTRGPGFECADCTTNTLDNDEQYMVHDEVWQAAINAEPAARANPQGALMLCVGCIETRLGRALTPGDFQPIAYNDIDYGPKSPRLLDRMTHHPREGAR